MAFEMTRPVPAVAWPSATSPAYVREKKLRSAYLFWVLLLLPMDWFAPTGLAFREFGAKPATLLLTLGGLYALVFLRPISATQARRENWAIAALMLLNLLNLCAFSINIAFGWSDAPNARNPVVQFTNQSALILLASLALLGNARYLSRVNLEAALTRALPKISAIHVLVWVLETAFPSDIQQVLSPFRPGGISIDRASGLMSEPSYYGTMAGLFATPMLLAPQFRGRWGAKLLAVSLLASAMYVSAKTMVVVVAAQALLFVITAKRGRIIGFLALLYIGSVTLYFIQTRAVLALEENMSSAMRLGSSHLAANVAMTGTALSGIGAGQFHFHYKAEYAPDYLMLSDEALTQMSPQAEYRASTFNFFLRALIELGVFGFTLLLVGLLVLIRGTNETSRIQQMMLVGAIAFLLTQDTYFYPPLILSAAMLLAAPRAPKDPLRSLRSGTSNRLEKP